MVKLISRFKENGKYKAQVECGYCGKHFIIDASNLSRTKSCGCVTNELIAKANAKHNAYSKHFPNKELKKAIDTITLMNLRVSSQNHPRYFQICDFLNITKNGKIAPANWLLENFGVKQENYSIERIDNSIGYVCGDWHKCEYCKQRKLKRNIAGYIPSEEQIFNKSNTTTFELNGIKFCFNRLGKHVPIDQNRLNYYWYRKYEHLEKEKRFELIKDKLFHGCDICKQIEMLNCFC